MKRDYIINALLTLLTSGVLAAIGFAFTINARVAVMESKALTDESSRKIANDILVNWPAVSDQVDKNEGEISEIFDMYDLKTLQEEIGLQRLTKVETKVEIYHPQH